MHINERARGPGLERGGARRTEVTNARQVRERGGREGGAAIQRLAVRLISDGEGERMKEG